MGINKTLLERKKQGLCEHCGKQAARENKIYCADCAKKRNKDREKRRKANPEKYAAQQAKYQEDRRTKYLSQGICWKCKVNPLIPGIQYCIECQEKKKQDGARRKKERLDKGLCEHCGKNNITAPTSVWCRDCHLKNMSWRHFGTRDQWESIDDLLKKQNSKCVYTGKELILGVNASLDHIIPKAKNGETKIENLQWVDFHVNMMKRDMNEDDFLSTVEAVYNHRCKN